MINLSAYNPAKSKPATLTIVNPYTGEAITDEKGKDVTITVHSMGSSVARNKFIELKKQNKDVNSEDTGAEILAAVTESWSDNFVTDDGKLECTFENAKKVYASEDWIAAQVLDFAKEPANFAPKTLKA